MTLDISIKRIDNVAKDRKASEVFPKYKRGKDEPANSTISASFCERTLLIFPQGHKRQFTGPKPIQEVSLLFFEYTQNL
jgi:hypothetical protein